MATSRIQKLSLITAQIRRPVIRSGLYEIAPGLATREPAARDGLLARVELDRVRPVGVQGAEERVLPAREREERDRRRDADVDADHPDLDVVAEAPDGRARFGEDR